MNSVYHTELSSHEGTRCQFNGGRCTIKSAEGWMRPVRALGIDVHEDFYVVVVQRAAANPQPPQRFSKEIDYDAVERIGTDPPGRERDRRAGR